jgi:CheY-like chemotaxis protein
MQIDLCRSGNEAIDAVKSRYYDLIFMDHMMPGMDGIETTIRIRELAKKNDHCLYCQKVPIVALTANAVIGMKELFLQNGMDDFVSKPIDPMRLGEVLLHWIPKEKQLLVDSKIIRAKAATNETLQIPGVNTRVGIFQTGGTPEGYIRVIGTLCSELETKVGAMERALKDEDLETYKIHVHSYKSFLATIGVMPLSVTAAMLEVAAQKEDRAAIDVHHYNFVRDLRELSNSVAAVLSAMGEKVHTAVISVEDSGWLSARLEQLRLAIVETKMQQIDAIMDDLLAKHWTKEIAERLEKIMQRITLFEWAEATGQIDQLQGELHSNLSCTGRFPGEDHPAAARHPSEGGGL